MAYYYNAAGQRFILPERPLEPPDVWEKPLPLDDYGDYGEEEYDRAEDEMNGKFNRLRP